MKIIIPMNAVLFFVFSSVGLAIELTEKSLAQLIINEPGTAKNYLESLDAEEAGNQFYAAVVSDDFYQNNLDISHSNTEILPTSHVKVYYMTSRYETSIKSLKIDLKINYLKFIILALNSTKLFEEKSELITKVTKSNMAEKAKNKILRFINFCELISFAFSDQLNYGFYPEIRGIKKDDYLNAMESYKQILMFDTLKIKSAIHIVDMSNNNVTALEHKIINLDCYDTYFHIFYHLIFLDGQASASFGNEIIRYYKKDKFFKNAFIFLVKQINRSLIFSPIPKEIKSILFVKNKDKKQNKNFIYPANFHANNAVVLFNNDGFESAHATIETDLLIKGNPIDIDGIRTGYNIHLPDEIDKTSAVLVHVYGGKGPEYQDSDFTPYRLNTMQKYLLTKKIVIATLNLPERLLLSTHQNDMTEEISNAIHTAINNFFEIIHNHPEQLINASRIIPLPVKEKVINLKKLPKSIGGESFGGQTAVRHIQRYPGTFIGAISHAGSLVGPNPIQPIYYIDDLKDKVLLLHNLEDNTVPVLHSKIFYDSSINKNRYLHLFIDSSPYYLMKGLARLNYRGHNLPVKEHEFHAYGRKILAFIRGEDLDDDQHQQSQLIHMLDENNVIKKQYLKSKHSPIWYIIKENIPFATEQKGEIRSIVEGILAPKEINDNPACSVM